jgi:hypothetical protein
MMRPLPKRVTPILLVFARQLFLVPQLVVADAGGCSEHFAFRLRFCETDQGDPVQAQNHPDACLPSAATGKEFDEEEIAVRGTLRLLHSCFPAPDDMFASFVRRYPDSRLYFDFAGKSGATVIGSCQIGTDAELARQHMDLLRRRRKGVVGLLPR